MAAFQFLAVSSYAIFLDIARYAFGKVRINILAINIEISSNSNDRFGLEAATGIAADIWRGLQSDYDMQTARRDSRLSAILDNIRRAAAML